MHIQRTFLTMFSFFFLLWSFAAIPMASNQSQIDQIDRQIQELQEMKRGYEVRALRHEDYAQRLQFNNDAYLETRRHIELADENRAKAEELQEQIDILQAKRNKLTGKVK